VWGGRYNGTAQKVRMALPAGALVLSIVVTLVDDAPESTQGSERWGTLRSQKLACVGGVCEFVLPPTSFSMLK
jgi:hypothetical protein